MPSTTRSPWSRPPSAPAYYLARPAGVWITAQHTRPPAGPPRPAGNGTTLLSERNPR
jgi:hypothetical protein